MVDSGRDNSPAPKGVIWTWVGTVGTAGAHWESISEGLVTAVGGGASTELKVTDIVFADENRVYAAVGVDVTGVGGRYAQHHFYICEGLRPASGTDWTWYRRSDVDAAVAASAETRLVNKLGLIPGTNQLLVAARHKSTSAGGLFPVNTGTWQMGAAWLGGTYTGSGAPPSDAMGRLGVNVMTVAVDRLGKYLYAGCSGGDTPNSPGRGGLVRYPLTNGVPGEAEILAGFGDVGTTEGDVFHIRGVNNFNTMPHGTTQDWEYCTRINDIKIDPNNPRVAYAAVGPGNLAFYHENFGAWRVADSGWTHVWGGGETGSGAKTVGISPVDYAHLYVGSVVQEFFVADIDISPHPIITGAAAYPLWAGATGTANVFAVAISPAASIGTASVDFSSLGGPPDAVLLDDGNDPDLVDGDGIFTSQRFAANVTAPGSYSVPVFAQAYDGGYDLQAVAVTVLANVAAPVIAAQAVYPVLAASTDTTTVLSVAVSSSTPIVAVNAALSGLGGTGSARLRDDGKLEDMAAGDGIYTSTRFQAGMGTESTYSTTVTAEPMYGAVAQQLVTVEAVASKVKFKDFSSETGDLKTLLTANPYSSVYFKSSPEDDASSDVMVVTFDDNSTWPLLLRKAYVSSTGVPVFSNQSREWLSAGSLPEGGRGICYADYDNDGDNDLFICNVGTEAMLLENRLNVGGGFVDQTDEMFGAYHDSLYGSIAASWGDYNGDGFIDLLVTTTNYFGSVKNLTASTLSNQNITCASKIFRNVNGSAFQETEWGISEANNVHLAGCWADLDNDGDLDQISARFILNYLSVRKNMGYSYAAGDNLLVGTTWSISDPGVYFGANSVSVIDFDHDDYPDLLITGANRNSQNGLYGVKILRNNYGDALPPSQSFTAYAVTEGPPWNGTLVADFDLDGQDDILLLPKTPNVAPSLFMANGYSNTVPTYTDRGYTAGLRGGETNGGLAADFDGDHSYDVFMGRVKADQFLYKNVGQAPSSAGWLAVKLGTAGNSNGSLIGTKVVVTASGKRWTKTIDGGSGRGGQSTNELLFGLGDVTGSVGVTVKYPSHEEFTQTGVDVGTLFTDTEDSVATIALDKRTDHNPVFDYELQPGTADWIFKWRTRIKGDLTKDVVEVENFMGYASDGICGVGIEPQAWRTLAWGDADADFRVYWDGLWWQHEVRWRSLPCGANCTYRFKVTSAVGTNSSTSVIRQTTPVSYCIPDAVPNEQ
jgi:hypothetical protein